ncbi:MAG: hypothetical protein Q7J44_14020 [Pseudotabrizicola sp.]|uniref:hypothetical protein n=1 Tax=Pseudotabrizicola sp. TaxID=2939647 RepID=UPI002721DAF3|nr:hypothetical protein [Pseudotabrizicola sp.]MDO9639652.1 hypothetical protein [Pseudotabrizicola sp.]
MAFMLPKPALAKFTVEPSRSGYLVYTPDREVAAGPFTDRNRALMDCDHRQQEADAKRKRGPRPCMCCTQIFESDGPHNRLCAGCRLASHDTQAFTFINPRRRTG